MKGFSATAMLAACAASLLSGAGCVTYRDLVDPCYPERYNAQAKRYLEQLRREAIIEPPR